MSRTDLWEPGVRLLRATRQYQNATQALDEDGCGGYFMKPMLAKAMGA
jgi:hypothetical protein